MRKSMEKSGDYADVDLVKALQQDKVPDQAIRHIWLYELKKRNRARLREEKFEKTKEILSPDISQWLADREVRTRLMQIVESLGEACRKILLAFYYEGLSMKDILEQTDYENGQVLRNKKYKCMKQLEQMLAGREKLAQQLKSDLYQYARLSPENLYRETGIFPGSAIDWTD